MRLLRYAFPQPAPTPLSLIYPTPFQRGAARISGRNLLAATSRQSSRRNEGNCAFYGPFERAGRSIEQTAGNKVRPVTCPAGARPLNVSRSAKRNPFLGRARERALRQASASADDAPFFSARARNPTTHERRRALGRDGDPAPDEPGPIERRPFEKNRCSMALRAARKGSPAGRDDVARTVRKTRDQRAGCTKRRFSLGRVRGDDGGTRRTQARNSPSRHGNGKQATGGSRIASRLARQHVFAFAFQCV